MVNRVYQRNALNYANALLIPAEETGPVLKEPEVYIGAALNASNSKWRIIKGTIFIIMDTGEPSENLVLARFQLVEMAFLVLIYLTLSGRFFRCVSKNLIEGLQPFKSCINIVPAECYQLNTTEHYLRLDKHGGKTHASPEWCAEERPHPFNLLTNIL